MAAVDFFDGRDYFCGSAAHTTGGMTYAGNDSGYFWDLEECDLSTALATYGSTDGFICSSPCIGYNVDANHNRWVYITSRGNNGKLYAFKTVR